MISVVVCSHDPRPAYIDRTLSALKSQTLPLNDWELVVVDNASAEPLAERLDLSWHPSGIVRREPTLGLTHARLRGIRMSSGDPIVFVDDDNVLAPAYLEEVARIASEYSFLGSFGGTIEGEFESPPAEWTRRHWGHLAIREATRDSWSNFNWIDESMPLGAGLCVRRAVAEHYAYLHDTGRRNVVLDRRGEALLSGGDTDLVCCAFDLGMGAGTFTALTVKHLIPPGRLTEDYLVRLAEGIAYSGVVLRSFRPDSYADSLKRDALGRVADILRSVRMGRRGRRFLKASKDGVRRATEDLAANSNGQSQNEP